MAAAARVATLLIGENDHPFPFLLVKTAQGWMFDAHTGADKTVNRRVGENELAAIRSCLAFVDAQREHALKDRDSNGLPECARKFVSSPGTQAAAFTGRPPRASRRARRGVCGVMSFMCNRNGVVYQKNLDQGAPVIAATMTQYDPDSTWAKAQPSAGWSGRWRPAPAAARHPRSRVAAERNPPAPAIPG